MHTVGCVFAGTAIPQPGQVPSLKENPVIPEPVKPQPVEIPPPASAQRPGPVPLSSCDAGGCWSTNADRYNGGAGGVYLDKRGKPCQRQGPWMQCF